MNLGSLGSLLGPFSACWLRALLALAVGYFLIYGKVAGAFFAIVTMALSFAMASLGAYWSGVFGGSMALRDPADLDCDRLRPLEYAGEVAGANARWLPSSWSSSSSFDCCWVPPSGC